MKELERYIELDDLTGKWYIHLTNFPMWLKGDRQEPTFNYQKGNHNGKVGLTDKVEFLQKGKLKSIKGFDTPTNQWNTSFVWRGKGWMSILTSHWKILYVTNDWMIIYFEKTLFTPAGFDIISRKENLDQETVRKIEEQLKWFKIEKELTNIR